MFLTRESKQYATICPTAAEPLIRPLLFGTTEQFLRSFGVKSLEDLPELSAVQVEEFKQQAESEVQLQLDI